MLSSAKSALLVHRVPIRVLAYRYCKSPLLVVGFYCLHRISTSLHPSDRWGFEKLGYRYANRVPVRHGLYRYSSTVPVHPLVSGILSSLKIPMGIGTPCTVPVP
ncbi:hypothetical protein GQ457_18G016670 [Hibiscus cannabinus]